MALVCSCKDKDLPEEGTFALSNVEAESQVASVVFTWQNPSIDSYYYTLISYTDAEGNTVREKASIYSVDDTKGEGYTKFRLSGFDNTNTYNFTLTPYTVGGVAGESVTVSCAPEDASAAYKYVIETVTAEPSIEGCVFSWTNVYGVPVTINYSFTDCAGETKTGSISSDKNGSQEIYAFSEATKITFTATNSAGAVSNPVELTVTPSRGEIPQSRMKIVAYSTYWAAGWGPENLLDGKVETTWHTDLSGYYPHFFVVDLGTAHKVNWVEVCRRHNEVGAIQHPSGVEILYSTDNSTFTSLGEFDFDKTKIYGHTYNFSPVVCRYIRVNVLNVEGARQWTYLSEFLAYYADSADHYASEAAQGL